MKLLRDPDGFFDEMTHVFILCVVHFVYLLKLLLRFIAADLMWQ